MQLDEKAKHIAESILADATTSLEKFRIAGVLIMVGCHVAVRLVQDRKVSLLLGADLLFDLRRAAQTLEQDFGGPQ